MLTELLHQLFPSGHKGFEGLISRLLSELTGLNFRLAKSGYQAGRDLGSRDFGANVIAVEAKRYGSSTSLNKRELLGEIVEAVSETSDLDLWVLVTTRDLDIQLFEALNATCNQFHIQFLHISAESEPLKNSLAMLCANAPSIVLEHLTAQINTDERDQIQIELQNFAETAEYANLRNHLREQLLSPLIGYGSWQHQQNKWFEKQVKNESQSRVAFGQILNVADEKINLVERRQAWQQFDSWWDSWTNLYQPLVILGEEGDGKTWSVAAWLEQKIRINQPFPAVVFVPSSSATGSDPYQIILDQLLHKFGKYAKEQWQKRFERWINSSIASQQPILLLALDGLNEQKVREDWRTLLEGLSIEPWRSRVAIILTCRTGYWRQLNQYTTTFTEYTLQPYDDQELNDALANYQLSQSDIPINLLSIIRKPRYFDLMVRHREKMAQSGDITIARLIYEDWKDRVRRKNHLEDLNHTDFQDLIRDLANKHFEKTDSLREREIEQLMRVGVNSRAILNELRTSNILHGDGNRLYVDKQYLIYGFGLLLVDELEKTLKDEIALEETLASWLEPHSDMDIKAEICAFAALHALQLPSISPTICVILLEAWISNRNSPSDAQQEFAAYMPQNIHVYIELAERVWGAEKDHRWIQELILAGFLSWQNNEVITTALRKASEKWLGFVHLYGFSWQRGQNESQAPQVQEKINQRVGVELKLGSFSYEGYQLIATKDDGLLRLGNLALTIISHLPRKPFIKAVVIGNLAEAIMGHPGRLDMYRWILITANESIWQEVEKEAEKLIFTNTPVTNIAAYHLLSYEGSSQARELQNPLPGNLFENNWLREQHELDPCASFLAWNDHEVLGCLQREDISPWVKISKIKDNVPDPSFELPDVFCNQLVNAIHEIDGNELNSVLAMTSADLHLETYEPAVCRFAPKIISVLINDVVGKISTREGAALTSLSLSLRELSLLLKKRVFEAIYQAWLTTDPDKLPTDELNRDAELFLFDQVLEMLPGENQLVHLLHRHLERRDLTRYAIRFKPLTSAFAVLEGLQSAQDVDVIKRTLQFLIPHINLIHSHHIESTLLPLLEHEDSLVRALVLEILFLCADNHLINRFLESEWSWQTSSHIFENHWGSRILCEYGHELPISKIFNRVHPAHWGMAIRCRGYDVQELDKFAELISLLLQASASSTVDIQSDLPLVEIDGYLNENEDRELLHRLSISRRAIANSVTFFVSGHGNWGGVLGDPATHFNALEESHSTEWHKARVDIVQRIQRSQFNSNNSIFLMRFSTESLSQLWQQHRTVVEQWLETILVDTPSAHQALRKTHAFYQALCEVLLKEAPEDGIRLYHHLSTQIGLPLFVDADTKIDLLDFALFNAQVTDTTKKAWRTRFEKCQSDLDLLKLAIAAQKGKAEGWLHDWITAECYSSIPLFFSRAVTLLAMLDGEIGRETLVVLSDQEPKTWRSELVGLGLKRWHRNAFAKYWFRQFFESESDIDAWAAFRIFLTCIDGRYWMWCSKIIESIIGNSWHLNRLRFLQSNTDTIRNHIRKNEDKLFRDTLFGQKVKKRQAWPWV